VEKRIPVTERTLRTLKVLRLLNQDDGSLEVMAEEQESCMSMIREAEPKA